MPEFNLTSTWSDPVPVQAGDVVQNTGRHMVMVCAVTPAADADSVEILPNRGISITAATEIRARSASRHGSALKVIRGL